MISWRGVAIFGAPLLLFFLSHIAFATGDSLIPPFDLAKVTDKKLPAGWRPITFHAIDRHTSYSLVQDETGPVLQAKADRSASAIAYPVETTPAKTLSWRWKVASVLPKGDARTKAGDDYPARIYVIFKYDPARSSLWTRAKYEAIYLTHGRYPPHATLNYIWANRLPQGESIVSPYTDRSYMIALRSGSGEAGTWRQESVDVAGDYRKIFNEEPPPIEGIGIMTDTDNTGGSVTAWYADIRLVEYGTNEGEKR